MTNKFYRLTGILIVFMLAGLTACSRKEAVLVRQDSESETEVLEKKELQTETAGNENVSCYVYVCGQVAAPGVFELPSGSRVCDAIEAAGGMTEDASPEYWNLAGEVSDGEMIYVPTAEEAAELGRGNGNSGEAQTTAEGVTSDGRINLNTASKDQLMTIPGVGESKADSIIAYRQEQGMFQSTEDVMNISGIKEGMYAKIKDYISVGD